MKNFASLTAIQAAEGIREKKFTALDYVSGLADVIGARDPEIQAWAYFERSHVLRQAADLGNLNSSANYPLLGVPVGIKDIIDTADMPTENGTVLDAGRQPLQDATVVRLLRQAGALIMGKTTTTELAYFHPTNTRNPHNTNHTPGGSSSGSAAAVAAGMVPIALGTQTNGSVIRPASFCGIYGLKTTNGVFSRTGVLEQSPSLDTVGIFARSLEDLAAVAEVLASYDPSDTAMAPRGRVNYLAAARSALPAAPRFAFVKTPAWQFAEEKTQEAFAMLANDLMPLCEEVELPAEFEKGVLYHRAIMLAEIALNYGRYYDRGEESLSGTMRKAIEDGREVHAVDYCAASKAREVLYSHLEELLEPYDAILTPPALGPAPAGTETTGNPVFCTLWTYLRTPAINLPFLQIDGLPLGIQLVGRRFEEARLFRCASWLVKTLSAKGYNSSC